MHVDILKVTGNLLHIERNSVICIERNMPL